MGKNTYCLKCVNTIIHVLNGVVKGMPEDQGAEYGKAMFRGVEDGTGYIV